MEKQRTGRGAEREVARSIEDHEVEFGEGLGDLRGLAFRFFLLSLLISSMVGEKRTFRR